MYNIPSGTQLYTLAQNRNWNDTSVGESQWIVNMKQQYGNNWRRRLYDNMMMAPAKPLTLLKNRLSNNPKHKPCHNFNQLRLRGKDQLMTQFRGNLKVI